MHVVVTGAGGFIGTALVTRLLERGQLNGVPFDVLTLVDTTLPDLRASQVRPFVGSLGDAEVIGRVSSLEIDYLFHLAAVPGGAAEADPALGWAINFDATRSLIERLAARGRCPRVVYCSSIAVFGVPLPPTIDDDTLPLPTMAYGAQKLMMETFLTDYVRRGAVDARSVRLPGIVARPRQPSGLISAFMSDVFHAALAGEAFVLPVSEQATAWMMSVQRCVDNLIHAAEIPAARLTARRAWTLPALRLSMSELIDGLAAVIGEQVRQRISYAPVPAVEAQFGSQPPLTTAIADALGFEHDGDVVALCQRVVTGMRDQAAS